MRRMGDKLIALAGPRIRSPWRGSALERSAVDHLPDRHLARAAVSEIDAAQLLVQQLHEDWRAMVPWSILRADPVSKLRRLTLAGLVATLIAAALGTPTWLLTISGVTMIAAVARTLGGRRRAIARATRELHAKIELPVALGELESEIVAVLRVDPDHDAARLLFAQLALLNDAPLGALMQLAPLRDHHPDEGIVVFLAALAYARLGAYGDAARMLGALRIDPRHPWNDRIRLLERHCRRNDLEIARVSSGEIEGDL